MTWRAWLAVSFALFAACIWLMTLGGCASAGIPQARKVMDRGLQGVCELPPEVDEDFVRTFCEESPDLSKVGCGYVGWLDGELCLAIVESSTCAEDDWKLVARWCGDEFRIMYSVRDLAQLPIE
jgi:hypothetical protein